MKINPRQKSELKKILLDMGDEKDIGQMSVLESEDLNQNLTQQQRELRTMFRSMQVQNQAYLKDIRDTMLEGLKGLAEAIKDTRQQDWSGFFKDFPTLLSQIGDNTAGTKEVIQNLKWNASQQLRDVNGSPVNPAIAGFGITTTYDDIQLAYTGDNLTRVDYLQNGQVKARLVLTYSGDNLTEVARTI